MLCITAADAQDVDPGTDDLGRSRIGYDSAMSDEEAFLSTRGCWVLGARADREQFALVCHKDQVRLAIAITAIVTPTGSRRRAIEGKVLGPGDAVYDHYIGRPSPVGRVRNPVTYFTAPVGSRTCRCGCGETIQLGDFLPGHDLRAVLERIARFGGIVPFLDWFDGPDGPTAAAS